MSVSKLLNLNIETLEKLIFLDQKFFPNPWQDKDWINLDLTDKQIFIIKSENTICGYVLFGVNLLDQQAHLLKILIEPRKRGIGLAKIALADCLDHLKKDSVQDVYLEVATNNTQAIGLYKSLGFKILVLKKRFYSNGEDAYAMQKFLIQN